MRTIKEDSLPVLGTRQEKKAFYRHAWAITAPIALQNFMNVAVDSADVILLSFVSQEALAASSLSRQVAFILNMLLFGISSCAAILGAQYWGKGDKKAVERVLGLTLRVALLLGAVFTAAAFVFPSLIMKIFTDDPVLIREGTRYLRAVSASYLTGGFVTVYLSVMRSVERVKMSAAVHSAAVVCNVILNCCFIFGWGPFPVLGITGVAFATSITRVLEAVYCIADGMTNRFIRLRIRWMIAKGGELMRDFIRYAVPAVANDVIWGLAFSVYAVILGHLSADIVAANSIATVVRDLGTVVCYGVSSAAGIVLGQAMGDNRLEEARIYAARFIRLAMLTALVGGCVILLCRPLVLAFLDRYVQVTDIVRSELSTMLYISSYYIFGAAVNTMLVCGIFRSGGDVKFGLCLDLFAMWGYAVPMGLLCAFVFKIPEMWVYFVLCLDEFVKMPAFVLHYRRRNWLRNITRELD